MKRFRFAVVAVAALASGSVCIGLAAGRFDQKLPLNKQPIHVLNRLTFGPRPGDLEQIRAVGLEKWIDRQLHPDQVAENAILESRLKRLDTLQLETWRISEKYPQNAGMMMPMFQPAFTLLPPQQQSRLMNGSVEERRNTLASLDAKTRLAVLGSIPQQVLTDLGAEIQEEANKARQAMAQERNAEMRRLNPPLNELLSPEQMRLARGGTREEKEAFFASLHPDKRRQVIRGLGPQAFQDFPELRREALGINQPQQLVHNDLIENKLFRAIYSNHQLEEVLVDFWLNHFNVYNGKGPIRLLLTSYERDAIRPHVFGRFKDLLLATAHHPAMLYYLDNWQSQAPREDMMRINLPAGARLPGLNENYARELMELHTLGVDGGYTQEDVVAVARAFTGWTIFDPNKYAEFQFNPGTHDRKEKVILEHTLPPGRGEQDGLDVIDILARHPSTAKFISRKLAQRFVADQPPQSLIDRMAAVFRKTDGDLRAVLQTMFSSVEFLSEGAWQSKIKSPFEMVVSSARALDADVTDAFTLSQRVADLGEPLYAKVEPTGYPESGESWINTAGLLGRFNFANALTTGGIFGVRADLSRFNFKDPSSVASLVMGVSPSPSTVAAIEKGIQEKEATPSLLTSMVLSAPEFQRR